MEEAPPLVTGETTGTLDEMVGNRKEPNRGEIDLLIELVVIPLTGSVKVTRKSTWLPFRAGVVPLIDAA